jgi:hypothetical protein
MLSAVYEALAFAIRVTWYIFSQIFIGYNGAIRWGIARSQGEFYDFPIGAFLWAVILTIALILFTAQ